MQTLAVEKQLVVTLGILQEDLGAGFASPQDDTLALRHGTPDAKSIGNDRVRLNRVRPHGARLAEFGCDHKSY